MYKKGLIMKQYICLFCKVRPLCKSHYYRHCHTYNHMKNIKLLNEIGIKKYKKEMIVTDYRKYYKLNQVKFMKKLTSKKIINLRKYDNKHIKDIFKIYKITNTVDDKIYIGSTHLSLKKKLTHHNNECTCSKLKRHINRIGFTKLRITKIIICKNKI